MGESGRFSGGPSRRQVLQAGVLTAGAVVAVKLSSRGGNSTQPVEISGPRRPNLLLLVTDDQRADSLGYAGNSILKTPNIDALAANGVRFVNSFSTSAICMSSRASILTGMHTRLHGVDDFAKPLAAGLFEQSYPTLLRQAGYRMGFIGKWGIDRGPMPTTSYDYFKAYQGQGAYFEPETGKHLTVVDADQAIEFLHGCSAEQSFCLAVSFKAPHVQDEGRSKPGIYAKYPYDRSLGELYQQDQVPPVATVDATPLPEVLRGTLNQTREALDFRPQTYQETLKSLYRLLTGVDHAVGRIADTLKSLGFDQNTVVLYTSDHGSFYGEHGFGGKWLMHEESIRTPMILCDPRLPASQQGTLRQQMVLNLDVPATLLDLAGITAPVGMQGQSLLPLARGQSPVWRGEWFYENHFRNQKAGPIAASEGIRTTDWKFIRYIDADPICEQLFDLKNDPREQKNLAEDPAQANRLEHLRGRWRAWNDALDQHRIGMKWTDPA